MQRRVVWRFREHCLTGLVELPTIADQLDAIGASLDSDRMSAEALAEVQPAVERTLAPAIDGLPSPGVVESTVSDGSSSAVDALLAMVRQTPVTLALHAENEPPPSGARPVDTRPVALQDLARQAFDAIRIERIRSSTASLVESVERARTNVSELPHVFSFAYEEAQRELSENAGDGKTRAHELVTEALRSTAESLRSELRDVEADVADAQGRLAAEISGGSLALLDRVAAGRMQARLIAARSRVSDTRAWINETWGTPLNRAVGAATTWIRALPQLGRRMLRRGTAIVGAGPRLGGGFDPHDPDPGRLQRGDRPPSARLPAALHARAALGLGAPPGPFERARDGDPALRQWLAKDGVPLVVRGRQGSGVTSFINALASGIAEGGVGMTRTDLEERITDEADLAALLCAPMSCQRAPRSMSSPRRS